MNARSWGSRRWPRALARKSSTASRSTGSPPKSRGPRSGSATSKWGLKHALYTRPEPVLRKLDQIECRDAVLEQRPDGSFGEAQWPTVDFIIGNPPFLGGKVMR